MVPSIDVHCMFVLIQFIPAITVRHFAVAAGLIYAKHSADDFISQRQYERAICLPKIYTSDLCLCLRGDFTFLLRH